MMLILSRVACGSSLGERMMLTAFMPFLCLEALSRERWVPGLILDIALRIGARSAGIMGAGLSVMS